MSDLPSWLNSPPAPSFMESVESGFKLGQSWREGNERISLAKQQLAASERNAAMNAQVRREQIQSSFERAQTENAITKAHQDAMYGLAQRRINIEGTKLKKSVQDKAKEISDTVGYANAVATGTPQLQARSQFPMAKLPAGEEKPPAAAKPDPYVLSQYKTAQSAYLNAVKDYEKATDPNEQARLSRIATNYRQQAEKIQASLQGSNSPAAAFGAAQSPAGGTVPGAETPPAAATAKQFTDKSGAVFSYTGTSDNPASDKDPSHWQQVAK